MFQFYAAQTLLYHVRENWRLISNSLGVLESLVIPRIRDGHLPVKNKLIQVLVSMMISGYPEKNYLAFLDNFDDPLKLQILSELPNELERFSSLSNTQYSFKHYLQDYSSKVINLIQSSLNSPEVSKSLQCFNTWCGFSLKFRKDAIDSLVPLLCEISNVEVIHSIIFWLESGVEDFNLGSILPSILNFKLLIDKALGDGDYELISGIAKIYRLYGELVIERIFDSPYEPLISNLIAFTKIEYEINFPACPDVSLFWIPFIDFSIESGKSEQAKKIVSIVNEVLCERLLNIPHGQSYFDYRDGLEEVFCAIFTFQRDSFLSFISTVILYDDELGCWLFGAVSEVLDSDNPLVSDLLRQISSMPLRKTVLNTLEKANRLYRENQPLLRHIISSIIPHMLTFQNEVSKILELSLDKSIDDLILTVIPCLDKLSEEALPMTWSCICISLSRSASGSDNLNQINLLCNMLQAHFKLDLLSILIRNCGIRKIANVPVSMRMLIEKALSMPFNDDNEEEYKEFCTSMIETFSKEDPEMTFSTMRPCLEEIFKTLRPGYLSILETLIAFSPVPSKMIAEELVNSVLRLNQTSDETWINLLPVLTKCLRHENSFSHSTRVAAFLIDRIRSISISDDYLRLIIRFITMLNPNIPDLRADMVETFIIGGHLTDSQCEIVAPLVLELLSSDPIKLTSNERILRCGDDNVKKLRSCRSPRILAQVIRTMRQSANNRN